MGDKFRETGVSDLPRQVDQGEFHTQLRTENAQLYVNRDGGAGTIHVENYKFLSGGSVETAEAYLRQLKLISDDRRRTGYGQNGSSIRLEDKAQVDAMLAVFKAANLEQNIVTGLDRSNINYTLPSLGRGGI